jgi:hypothetical protein
MQFADETKCLDLHALPPGVADGLRKCSGHDEHHVTLYTYVTLYISKSRPAMAGVADRAPPPMIAATTKIKRYARNYTQKICGAQPA